MGYSEGTEESHQVRVEFILGSRKQYGKVGYCYLGWRRRLEKCTHPSQSPMCWDVGTHS